MSDKKQIPVEFEIDKGIPVKVSSSKYPLEEMEVGDSFLAPKNQRPSISTRMTMLKKTMGREYTSRTVSEDEVRVWRVK